MNNVIPTVTVGHHHPSTTNTSTNITPPSSPASPPTSVGSRCLAYFTLKLYATQYVMPRRADLGAALVRISGLERCSLERRSQSCINQLVAKVRDWSRPGPGGCNTRELRQNPALLREVVVVLESLVYVLYDEQQTTGSQQNSNSNSSSGGGSPLAVGDSVRSAVEPAVSTLTAFAARASLFGYTPPSKAGGGAGGGGGSVKTTVSSSAVAAAVPTVYSTIFPSAAAATGGVNSSSQLLASALQHNNKQQQQQQQQDDTSSNTSSSNNTTVSTAVSDARSEVDVRTAAMFLISALVHLQPDTVFPLWSTLFPDGDPTEPSSKCTLLSPLMFDDFRVRCAAIYTSVALITAVSSTLSVVPLEVRGLKDVFAPQKAQQQQKKNLPTSSPTKSSHHAAASASSGFVGGGGGAYQSDISRVAFVLLQVFHTILNALKIQHERAEAAAKAVAVSSAPANHNNATSSAQQLASNSNTNSNTKGEPAVKSWGKLFSTVPNSAPAPAVVTAPTTTTSSSNSASSSSPPEGSASLDHHVSGSLRMLLINALGTLATVVPFHRATSVAKLLFAFLEENPRVLIAPIEAGADTARAEGGAIHDQGLSASLFLMATLNNSVGSRHIVRLFENSPTGATIIDAGVSVLPHIDAWKLCSAVARHHPETLRKFWSRVFGAARDLFAVVQKQQQQQQQQQQQPPKIYPGGGGRGGGGKNPSQQKIPYQAHLECLRTFVYFIGVRALPWDSKVSSSSSSSSSAYHGNKAASSSSLQHHQSATPLVITAPKTAVRRKTVGAGIAPNVVPIDSSDEREISDHRATIQEVGEILTNVALPATRSPIDNVRCVAYRILGGVPDAFFASEISGQTQLLHPPSAGVAQQQADANNNNINVIRPDSDAKQSLSSLVLDKCRAEVDEARVEALTVVYSWVAFAPSMQRAFPRISKVVCDELLGRGLLSSEGKTRACQVVEMLSQKIQSSRYPLCALGNSGDDQDAEEEQQASVIADECGRILKAAWKVLQSHTQTVAAIRGRKQQGLDDEAAYMSSSPSAWSSAKNRYQPFFQQQQQQQQRHHQHHHSRSSSGGNCVGVGGAAAAMQSSASSPSASDTLEATLQIATCLRACAQAVCALPPDYLFQEFGPHNDELVSWLFALLREHAWPLYLSAVATRKNSSSTTNSPDKKKHRGDSSSSCTDDYDDDDDDDAGSKHSSSTQEQQKKSTTNNNNNNNNNNSNPNEKTLLLRVDERDSLILVSVMDSLSKMLCAEEVAGSDPDGAKSGIDVFARAIENFASMPHLSREMYRVAGTALRCLTRFVTRSESQKIMKSLLLDNNNNNNSSSNSNNNNRCCRRIVEHTLAALRRSVNDADVARSGLQEDFNDACAYALQALVPLAFEHGGGGGGGDEKEKHGCEEEEEDKLLAAVAEEYKDVLHAVPLVARVLTRVSPAEETSVS